MKKLFAYCVIFVSFLWIAQKPAFASETIWPIQSIDTMKLSRDRVNDPSVNIPFWVEKVASLHANYIAIDTPYDDEFLPVLQKWVSEARKNKLHVWFRGNFSGWEGWFHYPKFTNPDKHYALTENFILSHPDLFHDGDIFTPAPEPENGAIGDPRSSAKNAQTYNTFLVTSYSVCKNAMNQVHKKVLCGYFSMNGDIARQVLTQNTVNNLGVVVIDHYVSDPSEVGQIVDDLYAKFGKPIVLGEFGAPIPDINGNMTDEEQAQFIQTILHFLYARRDRVQGLNYWVIAGGSTALYTDTQEPKAVANSILQYYNPYTISGTVKDSLGNELSGMTVQFSNGSTQTDQNGNFSYMAPEDTKTHEVSITNSEYNSYDLSLLANQTVITIVLQPVHADIWYQIRMLMQKVLQLVIVQ